MVHYFFELRMQGWLPSHKPDFRLVIFFQKIQQFTKVSQIHFSLLRRTDPFFGETERTRQVANFGQ
jgi:hypothetical protein